MSESLSATYTYSDEINILWGLGIEGKAGFPRPRLGNQNESPAQEHGHLNRSRSMNGKGVPLIETRQGLLDFFLHTTGMRLALKPLQTKVPSYEVVALYRVMVYFSRI